MRTRKFRVAGIAVLLAVSMSLVMSPVSLAAEPVAEEAAQQEWSNSWSPLRLFLHVWKAVVGVGDATPVPTDENGLTQATDSEEPDHGPSIEPNGRSL